MTPPLIHIGYHKAASTLLQDALFADTAYGFSYSTQMRLLTHRAFVACDPLAGAAETPLQQLRSFQCNATESGTTLVISHERLSGYPATGGYDQRLIADRLFDAFPDGRILIVVRRQEDVILSMYLQYITDGGSLSLRRFLAGCKTETARAPGFRYEFYEYHHLADYYIRLFGADHVLVLAFESVVADFTAAAQQISQHAGLSGTAIAPENQSHDRPADTPVANRARSPVTQVVRRNLNRMFRSQLSDYGFATVKPAVIDHAFKRIPFGASGSPRANRLVLQHYRQIIDRAVAGRYRRSNTLLQHHVAVELATYGYQIHHPERGEHA